MPQKAARGNVPAEFLLDDERNHGRVRDRSSGEISRSRRDRQRIGFIAFRGAGNGTCATAERTEQEQAQDDGQYVKLALRDSPAQAAREE